MKLSEISRLSEELHRHFPMPTVFRYLQLVVDDMKETITSFSSCSESRLVEMEILRTLYDVLQRVLCWCNELVDEHDLHELSTLPNADVNVALAVRGLGNLPSAWVDRFIDEVVTEAKRRMRHAFKERRLECSALVVRDLKKQLLMTKNYLEVGILSYFFPLPEKVALDGLPIGSCDLCEFAFGEANAGWIDDTIKLPCGHVFHWNCIEEWVDLSDGCCLTCDDGSFATNPAALNRNIFQRSELSSTTVFWFW